MATIVFRSPDSEAGGLPPRLAPLVAAAARRVERLRAASDATSLLNAAARFPRRSLTQALRRNPPAIIAEVKKASPSKGLFREDFDPIPLVRAYSAGSAAAISVVTEPEFFQGDSTWIAAIRAVTDLPILRKDFIIDPLQIAESAAAGADAVLLIVRILTPASLRELAAAAAEANLEVLFEIHDEQDLERVTPLTPALVGVNSRNLDDFTVDRESFIRLRPGLPAGAVAVAESGLDSPTQIGELSQVGYQAFLIGEALITSEDPVAALRALRSDTYD